MVQGNNRECGGGEGSRPAETGQSGRASLGGVSSHNQMDEAAGAVCKEWGRAFHAWGNLGVWRSWKEVCGVRGTGPVGVGQAESVDHGEEGGWVLL